MLKGMALAVACATLAPAAEAATVAWTATLDQAQEVPSPAPVPEAGGSASGTVDTDTGLLTWEVIFAGLSGPALFGHFHAPAPAGATAPVVVDIGGITGFTSTVTSGSATIPLAGVEALLDGLYYINVHTELNPAGEIRGQVSPVPLPAALPLLLAALGVTGLVARRRA